MGDIVLDELTRPSMFPREYVQGANSAMRQTRSIPRIGQLHGRIKEPYDRIHRDESSGGPYPGTLYVELDTFLFELKAISYLSSDASRHGFEYEPIGDDREGKTVDVQLVKDTTRYLVELKTTNPQARKTRIPVERFSADTLHANEMCYNWISSARSHLLEFLIDTESKLANYSGKRIGVLCAYKNFYVEEDELESLWHFYVTGVPHPGDTFGGMMQHEPQKKGIQFRGTIDELWALSFPQYGFELEADGFVRLMR